MKQNLTIEKYRLYSNKTQHIQRDVSKASVKEKALIQLTFINPNLLFINPNKVMDQRQKQKATQYRLLSAILERKTYSSDFNFKRCLSKKPSTAPSNPRQKMRQNYKTKIVSNRILNQPSVREQNALNQATHSLFKNRRSIVSSSIEKQNSDSQLRKNDVQIKGKFKYSKNKMIDNHLSNERTLKYTPLPWKITQQLKAQNKFSKYFKK